jgi:hypothetical protein
VVLDDDDDDDDDDDEGRRRTAPHLLLWAVARPESGAEEGGWSTGS